MDTTFSEVVMKVMARYPMEVKSIYLLSFKGKKAVWSVNTTAGEVILKKVPFKEEHIEFMIYAIHYLRNNGVRTPAVYTTVNGKGWVKEDGEYFVAFEVLHGRSPEYEIEGDLQLIMRGMASFHKGSKGIESPTGHYPSILAAEWENVMNKRFEKLAAWKTEVSLKDVRNHFDELFLQYADVFLEQCKRSIAMLGETNFDEWLTQTVKTKTLCHQDYAAGNLVIGNDGHLYVFDMDSLTVDVPIRDIRKILNKVMKKEASWEIERMIEMIKAYQEVNPLTKDQHYALAADLLYPHLFYGQVSKYYEDREKGKWTEEKHLARLNDMIATEQSKAVVLQAFLSRMDEVVITHG